jgi:nucleoid DNA-binding protein
MNTHFLPDIDFKKYNQRRNAKREETDYLEISTVNPLHRYRNYKRKGRVRRLRKMFADVNSEELKKNQRNHIEHDGVLRVRRRRNRTATNGRTRRTANASYIPTRRVERPSIGAVSGKIGTFAKELAENIEISRAFWAKIFRRRRRPKTSCLT